MTTPYHLTFNKDNTPLTFGNRIVYSIGESKDLIRIENDFYVSKIANYESTKITELEYEEVCGKKTNTQHRVFKESGPDQFYIKYTSDGMRKH